MKNFKYEKGQNVGLIQGVVVSHQLKSLLIVKYVWKISKYEKGQNVGLIQWVVVSHQLSLWS